MSERPLEKLLDPGKHASRRDHLVSRVYRARREYRRTCETAGKSGKQIERYAIASFQVAGFKGDFGQWEHLLRIGDHGMQSGSQS
ncbi:MAG: hypothetical protein WAM53_18100 [Terrimicrobiaceae bacterium]